MSKTIAIVTGASKGLGRAIALRLAAEGVQVVAAARSTAELKALAAQDPAHIHPVTCDIGNSAQVQALIAETIARYGQLDALVNNAGIGRFAPIDQLSEADWQLMLDVNVTGSFLTAKYAIPHLKQSKGHIVNISSIAGDGAFPGGGGYCASKAALNMLADSLMQELKSHEVRITTISPGSIKTSFHNPKDYALPPEQIADTVWTVLSAPKNVIYGKITIRPQVPPQR